MSEEFESKGGEFLLNSEVVNLEEDDEKIKIITPRESLNSKYLIFLIFPIYLNFS